MQLWWCHPSDLLICGHVSISTSRLWNRKLNLSRLHNSETDLNSVQFLDTQLVGAKLFISKLSTGEMLVRCSWTHLSLSFYIALIWVESSQSRRKLAVFLSAFFFFCFFFLASSPVTCLTFHPINSRTTSRTAGAKVVPLEPQTDKPAGSWLRVRAGVTALLQPLCTRPRCRGNSMSAERVLSELWVQTQLWGFKWTLHHEVCPLWMDYNSV